MTLTSLYGVWFLLSPLVFLHSRKSMGSPLCQHVSGLRPLKRYLAGDLPLAPSAMKRTQCRGRRRQAKAEASMSSSRTLSLSAPSAESETKAKAPP